MSDRALPLNERINPVSVSWVGPSGFVVMWNRYTGRFTFALENTPGAAIASFEAKPWCDGAENLAIARMLVRRFFGLAYRDPVTRRYVAARIDAEVSA